MSDSFFAGKQARLQEFSRLRDLMFNASRASSTGLSSISFDDNPRLDQSVYHHDIREADSLLEESLNHNNSLISIGTIVIGPNPPHQETEGRKRGSSSSQTCALLDSEELEELKRDFIPHLEEQLSFLESTQHDGQSKYDRLVARLKQYSVFEHVRGSLAGEVDSNLYFVGADEQSVDIFPEPGVDSPILSLPIKGANLRVSAKQRILSFFVLKTLRFVVYVEDMYRFKKLLYSLKLLGLPVSLVDVPDEVIAKSIAGDVDKPRRHVVRDQ